MHYQVFVALIAATLMVQSLLEKSDSALTVVIGSLLCYTVPPAAIALAVAEIFAGWVPCWRRSLVNGSQKFFSLLAHNVLVILGALIFQAAKAGVQATELPRPIRCYCAGLTVLSFCLGAMMLVALPAMVVEKIGVFRAFQRSFVLSMGNWSDTIFFLIVSHQLRNFVPMFVPV